VKLYQQTGKMKLQKEDQRGKRNMPIQTIKEESDGSGGELPIWPETTFLEWILKQTQTGNKDQEVNRT
jgi:hypothetical protein